MKRFSLPLALLLLAACSDLTAPAPYKPATSEPARAAAQPSKPTAVKPAAAPAPDAKGSNDRSARQTPPGQEMVSASHVLIAYQGAMRSQATRSKDEALKLAQQVADQAKGGKDLSALAKQHSDDKGSAAKGGDLGTFPARRMVKQFADAVIALKPGEISGVVESPFGFHVIRRSP